VGGVGGTGGRKSGSARRRALTVRLDADLHSALVALCRVRGVSVTAAVTAAIERSLCDVTAGESDRVGEILGAWGVTNKRGI
jgi:hypothetical protein